MARNSPAFVDLDDPWRSGCTSFSGTVNSQEATRRPLHLWRTSDPIAPADRTIPPGRVIARILDKMKYENQFIASYKFSNLHIGGPRRPVFFDISTTRPELLDLDRNSDVIRESYWGFCRRSGQFPVTTSWTRCSSTSRRGSTRSRTLAAAPLSDSSSNASASRRARSSRASMAVNRSMADSLPVPRPGFCCLAR